MKKTLKDFLNECCNDNTCVCLNIGVNGWYEQNRTATKKELIDSKSLYLDCYIDIIDFKYSIPDIFLEYSNDKHRKVDE